MAEQFSVPLPLAFRVTGLTVEEAVAITQTVVRALAASATGDRYVLVPSAGDLRLSDDGDVSWKCGASTAREAAAYQLGRLLSRLVAAAEHAGDRAAPQVKLAIDRAVGQRNPAPLESLGDFAVIVDRLGSAEPRTAIAALARRVAASAGDLPREKLVSIADVRQARRARGASLGSIAAETGISESLLRQLEWGILDHWPGGVFGDQSLRAYARAAGLDGDSVVAVVTSEGASEDAVPAALVKPLALVEAPARKRHMRLAMPAAAGVAIAIALGSGAVLWQWRASSVAAPMPVPVAAAAPAPAPVPTPVAQPAPSTPAPQRVATRSPRPVRAAHTRASRPNQARQPGTTGGSVPAAKEEAPRKTKTSFWNRPILIIKIGDGQDRGDGQKR